MFSSFRKNNSFWNQFDSIDRITETYPHVKNGFKICIPMQTGILSNMSIRKCLYKKMVGAQMYNDGVEKLVKAILLEKTTTSAVSFP